MSADPAKTAMITWLETRLERHQAIIAAYGAELQRDPGGAMNNCDSAFTSAITHGGAERHRAGATTAFHRGRFKEGYRMTIKISDHITAIADHEPCRAVRLTTISDPSGRWGSRPIALRVAPEPGKEPRDVREQVRFDVVAARRIAADLLDHAATISGEEPRPRVVCLCGSTRFYDAFQRANYEETMAGRIVLTVGHYPNAPSGTHGETVGCTPEQKAALDVLHKRKIDMADEVLVLNVGGYTGDSTRSEIEHARMTGKPIRWLEPEH